MSRYLSVGPSSNRASLRLSRATRRSAAVVTCLGSRSSPRGVTPRSRIFEAGSLRLIR